MRLLFVLFFTLLSNSVLQAQSDLKTATGLQIGSVAPEIIAKDVHGDVFTLSNTVAKTPVVLIFIRGQWCPVCNKHMSQLQDSLNYIQELGAQVVVISPEKPEFIEKTIEKSGAAFTILYDEGQKISDAFEQTFKPTQLQLFTYNTFLGASLKESHTDDSQRLPVPSTYVINQQQEIVWRHFESDYKQRASIADIVTALRHIKE